MFILQNNIHELHREKHDNYVEYTIQMHIYKCTNERTKTQEKTKHITIRDAKEKEYKNTWQKHDITNLTIEIWKKQNTVFFFYLRYLNKNLIVFRGLSYLLLLMLLMCEYLA